MLPLWNFFLTRRAFTILTMVALLVGGVWAIIKMPKESTPEVVVPIGIVTTILPGATSADVERLVTDKLEPSVRAVADIDKVTSSSRSGVSIITAQFIASADIETAIQDLRNAVEGVKRDLPSDAEAPVVTKVDFQNQPILTIGISSDLHPASLTSLAEDIEDDLLTLEGVTRVEISGVRTREVNVILKREQLATHRLRVEEVVSAIGRANASLPSGTIVLGAIEYPVQFKGDITDARAIAELPIKTSSGEVLLKDIATIIDGFEKESSISRLGTGGEPSYAMLVNVYKSSGGNILATAERVEKRVEELQKTILLGSEVEIVYSAANDVKKSIEDLAGSGRDTILLIILILFITIGFREALVAALAIPFSFMIAFLGMWATGNSINFISLFALIIAIGILVDSGIVVVEAIHTNRERGMEKMAAAKKAIEQFAWPLIAGTMTTVAVFVPLFFLSGIIGEFVKSIPFTIIVVLLASIVVALGFVPMIALSVLKHEESRFALYREKLWERIALSYRTKMQRLLENKRAHWGVFAFLTVSFVGALLLPITGLLKATMFPPADQDLFFIEIEMPQATTLAQTDALARKVEAVVGAHPSVASYLTTVGAASAFNQSNPGASSKYANITINLEKERANTSLEIAADMRASLSSITEGKVSVMEDTGGPPSGAPIVAKIWSDNTGNLAIATELVEKTLKELPGTRDVVSTLRNDGTELSVSIDREAANEYGLSASDIALTLRAALAGIEATKVRLGGDDAEVRVTLDLNPLFTQPEETIVASADALRAIPLATARGPVPLDQFVRITANRTSSVINHENGMRIGTVSAYTEGDANAVELTATLEKKVAALALPEGVRVTYGGDDEEIKRTFTEMLIALIAGLVLMFAILVLEFNAFRTTLRLLAAIPLSLTGVLLGLFVMGQPLSFTAFLGIIALAGVIINHGILLLDVLNHLRAEKTSLDPASLVLEASASRIRPILLTTITTVVGMIPLTFVSAMWAPLAFTIAFGLIYGTVLTLVFIPLLSYRRLVREQLRDAARM
jgi:multidrug efflux pump subunit AcrB